MAVEEQVSDDHLPAKPSPPRPPPFLEVFCKSSDKPRRFAAGTEAGFAVSLINKKLGVGAKTVALYIEAVKEGEEPVAFGPNSVLVAYGSGWRLQTVTAEADHAGDRRGEGFRRPMTRTHALNSGGSRVERVQTPPVSSLYIAKILLAFVFIFVLGSVFVLALEYLPVLILYMNSFM
ncbi:uncharacterized protein LOC116196074 [Punica granatum]|uniref:Uncharacterized protein n=2 Tax=Punica granatum TaxID=22663 RepID=A0A218X1X7_PUNGR|nr:uncharacterized protein LOC116196074 [Punica granatum]OWM78838.1 hypothetical protein CDL15_Pgr003009 [Punica granatum]PKI34839.1 hypothetical protein CRG98_044766 [Punica granatum]